MLPVQLTDWECLADAAVEQPVVNRTQRIFQGRPCESLILCFTTHPDRYTIPARQGVRKMVVAVIQRGEQYRLRMQPLHQGR